MALRIAARERHRDPTASASRASRGALRALVVDDTGVPRLVGIRIDVLEPGPGSFVVVTDGGAGTFLADRKLFIRWTEGPFDAGEFTWRYWSE